MPEEPKKVADTKLPRYKVVLLVAAAVAITYVLTPKVVINYHFYGQPELISAISNARGFKLA